MNNLTTTLIIIILVQTIGLILLIVEHYTHKAIIDKQNITIEKQNSYITNTDNLLSKTINENTELKTELHTLKYPKEDYIPFSILCNKKSVKWYKEKVEEIFGYFASGDIDTTIPTLSKLVYENFGYKNSQLTRVEYYSEIKNRKEFKLHIDTLENHLGKSILDIIKE